MRIAVDALFIEPRKMRQASRRDQRWSLELSPGYDNIGNYFIAEALTEILDFDEAPVVSTHISAPSSDALIDEVNQTCSALVLRGATMLRPHTISKFAPYDFLSRIKIPIVWVGVATENPFGVRHVPFTTDDIRSLRYIADSSPAVMVRGATTAQVLADVGITNTVELGCPTIYWSRQPENPIATPSWDRPAWTWRETLYTPDPELARALEHRQFHLVEDVLDRSGSTEVWFQDLAEMHWARYALASGSDGEFAYHFDYGTRMLRRMPVDRPALLAEIAERYAGRVDRGLVDRIANASTYTFDIDGWRQRALARTFVAGCRLHGNMIALSHGVPAFLYTYDERTQEVVDLLGNPSAVLREDSELPELASLDFSTYERRYRELYAGFHAFLENAGLPHRLATPGASRPPGSTRSPESIAVRTPTPAAGETTAPAEQAGAEASAPAHEAWVWQQQQDEIDRLTAETERQAWIWRQQQEEIDRLTAETERQARIWRDQQDEIERLTLKLAGESRD